MRKRNIPRYPRPSWDATQIVGEAGKRYFLRVTASGPAGASSDASFDIVEINAQPLNLAPYSSWWRVTNLVGFENPDGSPLVEAMQGANVFDPAQRNLTVIWDKGDEPHSFLHTPNIPTAWRDWNKRYGKQVVIDFETHGAKTILAAVYDTRGNYAFGVFNKTIGNPDTVIPANRTIYFSQAGTFPSPLPAGSVTATTDAQVRSAQLAMGNTAPVRIRLPFGENFVNVDQLNRGGENGLLIDCWGNPANGPAEIFNPGRTGPFEFTGPAPSGVYVKDLIVRGSYDATRDIGFAGSPFRGENSRNSDWMCFTRVKFIGWDNSTSGPRTGTTTQVRLYINAEITDFQNYGIGPDTLPDWWAFVGCDLHQNPDAISGHANSNGDQQTAGFVMGPQHGPLRTEVGFHTYVAMTSFFSKGGWFVTSNGQNFQPAHDQACVRFWHNFNDAALSASRQFVCHHHMWERVTFEGGDAVVALANSGRPAAERPRNFVMDRFIVAGTAATYDALIAGTQSGVTLRNGLLVRFNVPRSVPNHADGAIRFDFNNNPDLAPVQVHNVTFVNLMANADIRTTPPYFQVNFTNAPGSVEENNILLTPARSLGEAVSNLSTTPVEGFQLRYRGARWGFPPIGNRNYAQQVPGSVQEPNNGDPRWIIPATARREQPGNPGVLQPGPVAVGEWVVLPYPDYTGFCRGAGFPVTRAAVLANTTQYHQVSVRNVPRKRMANAGSGFGADGWVVFDFPVGQPYFRIQNQSDRAWTDAMQVSLDLSDYWMPHWAETAPPTTTVPQYRALSGSAAFQTGGTGLRAFDDALFVRRPGSVTDEGATIGGTASRGWLEPVA